MKYLILIFLIPISLFAQKSPVEYVNPFIGTGGHGHTFPGATVPFGMVQLSPDTRTEGWDAASGYHYSDSTILGFSHTHLNGTGVNDLCDVLILPMGMNLREVQKRVHTDKLKSRFQHKNEISKAGYYKTYLDDLNVQAELTASDRVGFHRYHFPDSVKKVSLFIDLYHRDELLDSTRPTVLHRNNYFSMSGKRVSKSWAKKQYLYFNIEANAPSFLIYKSTIINNQTIYEFDVSKTHELLIKVALSPVSEENAAENMQAEIPHWNFDKTRKEAEAKWSKYLNRIEIEGGTEDQRTIFYTALYHTLIHPSVWQDVNGDYRGLDNKVHNSKTFAYHSIFSLWDTYRALHPLYTILCPEKVPDFINGFLDDFEKAGHLPVWNFPGNETWCMIGNHSIPVIADAYLKGIKGFDAEKALNAMIKTVNRDTFGLKEYREKGYIPADTEGESVSKTLEYAYDDYCIAMMAQAMKKDKIYKEYIDRSQNWKNIFNPQTGFFQAKINETFVEPSDPREVNHHYTEGNAWQYAFAVQHDISGLINMQGGNEIFEAKLDSFFNAPSQTTGRDQVDITGLIGQYAHGNEPSHHIAYLYNYVGKPYKTQRLVRQIMDNFYKNAPDGLIGNEDCGQMSAWFVMSSMGFYPVAPCGGEYQFGSPYFEKISYYNDKDDFDFKRYQYEYDKRTIDSALFKRLEKMKYYENLKPPPPSSTHSFVARNLSSKNYFIGDIKQIYFYGLPPYDTSEIFSNYFLHAGLNRMNLLFEMQRYPDITKSNFYKIYDYVNIWNLIIPNAFISKGTKLFKEKQLIELACADEKAEIYFTTDGSNPILSGKKYTEPIEISDSKTIKFEARLDAEHSKIATATFKKIIKNKTIVLKNPPAPQYSGGETDALVDGEIGTEQWQLGGWQGFEGVDLEAIIDLKKETEFNRIELRCIEDQNAWIFAPTEIQIFTSNDGLNFKEISTQKPIFKPNTEGVHIRLLGIKEKGKARYIKVIAKPLNPIPAWHKGAGGKGWILADEIIID